MDAISRLTQEANRTRTDDRRRNEGANVPRSRRHAVRVTLEAMESIYKWSAHNASCGLPPPFCHVVVSH